MRLNYNIHNILKFHVCMNKQYSIVRNLNLPFSFFEVKEDIDDPDITINIGKFTPSNENCHIVDHKYYIKRNYFYCKDLEGRVRWEVEILGFENGKAVINFNGGALGPEFLFLNLIAQELLLIPMLIYKLSQKRYYLIHAGAVSKENYGRVFVGRGGSSKTEIIVDFVKSGFDYLGDDWIIISKNRVLSFPKNLSAFLFSIKRGFFPTESFSSVMDKIRYFIYSQKNLTFNDETLRISDSAILKTVYFISKTKTTKTLIKKEIGLEEAVMFFLIAK